MNAVGAVRRHAGSLLALLALAYLCVMLVTGARPRQGQFVPFEAAGVLSMPPAEVTGIDVTDGARRWHLERTAQGWRTGATALSTAAILELELGLKVLHAAKPVRELRGAQIDARAAEYGLDRPRPVVHLHVKDGRTLALAFGGSSADGALRYLRVEGRAGVSLVSPFVVEQWQKLVGALP